MLCEGSGALLGGRCLGARIRDRLPGFREQVRQGVPNRATGLRGEGVSPPRRRPCGRRRADAYAVRPHASAVTVAAELRRCTIGSASSLCDHANQRRDRGHWLRLSVGLERLTRPAYRRHRRQHRRHDPFVVAGIATTSPGPDNPPTIDPKQQSGSLMTIGEASRRSGFTIKALRFYERRGILRSASRRPNGYRVYCETDLGRMSFIRDAKALGLTLGAIIDIVNSSNA